MNDRPIIAITMRGRPLDESRCEPTPYPYEWLPAAFAAAIARAGGTPILVSNETDPPLVAAILAHADGLFLSGGEDVDPEFYGESHTVDNMTINRRRDEVELSAIAAADRIRMPILGVCRGIQVLNVARGGTLYQDLDRQHMPRPRDHTRGGSGLYVQTHPVDLAPGCRLADILNTNRVIGATSHHQAVRTPGRDLAVVGRSLVDGVIEAVEGPGERFVIGVQWHPEVRADDDTTVRLFRAFVEAAAAYARERG